MNRYRDLFTKISIHPLLWFVIALAIITGYFKVLIMLLIIVFAHEMGHAITAHFFRWRIKKISLLPFGGVVEVEEHGNRPLKEEFFVIIAGPLQHVLLMGIAYGLYLLEVISTTTLELFLLHNLVILLFNLLPIWPLDGGKLLFVILTSYLPFGKAHHLSLSLSFFLFALLNSLVFIYYPMHLHFIMISAFLLVAHYIEWKQRHFVHVRFLLERYYGKNRDIKKLKSFEVEASELVSEVILKFCRGCKHQVVIKQPTLGSYTFDENELLHAYFAEKRTTSTMGDLLLGE